MDALGMKMGSEKSIFGKESCGNNISTNSRPHENMCKKIVTKSRNNLSYVLNSGSLLTKLNQARLSLI
jgi:hypothetical protein